MTTRVDKSSRVRLRRAQEDLRRAALDAAGCDGGGDEVGTGVGARFVAGVHGETRRRQVRLERHRIAGRSGAVNGDADASTMQRVAGEAPTAQAVVFTGAGVRAEF
jgi:hypothetical protein